MHLSQDGLRLYVGGYNNMIYLYRLTTANSIGQIDSYSSFSPGYTPEDLHVSPDGTRMYVARSSGTIYQYNISDANNLATASYSNNSLNTVAGFNETDCSGVALSNEGRYLYFTGRNTDTVYQMEMTNFWELDSAVFAGANGFYRLLISSIYNEATCIEFSPDGMKFFVGLVKKTIRQYNCQSPYSLWGATLAYEHDVGIYGPNCMRFRPDGNALFILFGENGRIYEYSCSNYDIASLSATGVFANARVNENNPNSFSFGNNGYYMYIYGTSSNNVRQFYMPSPYYIGYMLNQGKIRNIGGVLEMDVKNGRIYAISGSSLIERGISSAEINSAITYTRSGTMFVSQLGNYGTPYGFHVSASGQYLFTVTSRGEVFRYIMSSAGNATTVQNPLLNPSGGTFRSTSITAPQGLSFSNDGRYFYIPNRGSPENIYMFSCSTAWQIGGSSYIRVLSGNYLESVSFSASGSVMLIGKTDGIERRIPDSAFNTASTYSTNLENFGTGYYRIGFNTGDLKFNPTGTRWYTNYINDGYMYSYQYTTSTAFELAGAIGQTHNNVARLANPPRGISVPTERRVFQNDDTVIQKGTLTADYNLVGMTADSLTLGTGYARLTSLRGMRFSSDGTKLYGMTGTNNIREYLLASAWDIATVSTTYNSVNTTALSAGYVNNITLSSDGLKFYSITQTGGQYGNYPQYVYEFNFGSAYSAPGSQYVRRFQVTGVAVTFSPDGSRMLVLESNFKVKTYLLTTAWNVSTAVYDSETYLPVGEIPDSGKQAADMVLRSDGKKLILLAKNTGNNHVYVNEYTLIISWTASTANWIRTYDSYHASHNNTFANSLDLRPDGQKMYILGGATTGSSSVTCFQYTLYTPT